MLAYLFWHWPRPQVATSEYEADLVAFHGALAAEPPPGFSRSLTCRVGPLPWLGGEASGYEDWYVVADSAALDPLNTAAVSGRHRPSHDRAAHAAAGGAGGLYRFQQGDLDLAEARVAAWFGKPDGVSYGDFTVRFNAWVGTRTFALWQRQMVLGPGREFCLLSREEVPLPDDFGALVAARRALG